MVPIMSILKKRTLKSKESKAKKEEVIIYCPHCDAELNDVGYRILKLSNARGGIIAIYCPNCYKFLSSAN
jgi:hypothetical protein